MLFEQHLQLEERLDAVLWRRAPPFGKSGRSGFYGRIDVICSAERNGRYDFARRGIDDVAEFRCVRVGPLAVDVLGKLVGRRCGYSHYDSPTIAKSA